MSWPRSPRERVFQSGEALKAMAVRLARMPLRMRDAIAAKVSICAYEHCQIWIQARCPRASKKSRAETVGELLWFQGKPAFTPYTRDCGRDHRECRRRLAGISPTLSQSHADPYCLRVPATHGAGVPIQADRTGTSQSQLRGPAMLDRIGIAERRGGARSLLTLAGCAESIRISASSLRFCGGARAGMEYGSRTSMRCIRQWGLIFEGTARDTAWGCATRSEQMGLAGRSYREILTFYYPGTALGLTGQGLSWQRLRGRRCHCKPPNPIKIESRWRGGAVGSGAVGACALAPTVRDRDPRVSRPGSRFAVLPGSPVGWPRTPRAGEFICSRLLYCAAATAGADFCLMNAACAGGIAGREGLPVWFPRRTSWILEAAANHGLRACCLQRGTASNRRRATNAPRIRERCCDGVEPGRDLWRATVLDWVNTACLRR